ncbi:MAG: hypothetical protein KF856_11575 [Cyclobacteriaceae bacterium]|nr:hypothetical protein [Cyclobacteriaceae bacterium]
MERLESIFDSIKERLTNPFIFSFIVAWLTFNWEVTLALFWFDSADLKTKGYSNLIDFIYANTNNWSWCIPILVALGYTFLMPLFRMGVEWFNALVLKWTNNRLFKISEETPVSYGKYFELKKEHKKLIDELASDVNTASQKAQEYADIQKRMTETEKTYSQTIEGLKVEIGRKDDLITKAEEEKLKQRNNAELANEKLQQMMRPIEGLWQYTYMDGTDKIVHFITNEISKPKHLPNGINSNQVTKLVVLQSSNDHNSKLIVARYAVEKFDPVYFFITQDADKMWHGFEDHKRIKGMVPVVVH